MTGNIRPAIQETTDFGKEHSISLATINDTKKF
jgi:hypothetical protein